MYQDKNGFYDVYGPLVYPWWKTTVAQLIMVFMCIALLVFVGFFLYKRLYKKRSVNDLEQLILHRTLLEKKQNSAVILYDCASRVLKTFFPEVSQKSSLTAQELVILIKNWQHKDLLDNSTDQLVSLVVRAERVRFGGEDVAWDVVYDDTDYVIAMAKKIQSISKK
jgi:hypothetical protein